MDTRNSVWLNEQAAAARAAAKAARATFMAKKAAKQHSAPAPVRELAGEGSGNGAGPRPPEQAADAATADRQNGSGPASSSNGSASSGPIIDVGDDLISTQKRIVAGAACHLCHVNSGVQLPGFSCRVELDSLPARMALSRLVALRSGCSSAWIRVQPGFRRGCRCNSAACVHRLCHNFKASIDDSCRPCAGEHGLRQLRRHRGLRGGPLIG